MRKVLLTTILITLLITPCYAAKEDVPEVKLQSIFLTDTKDVEDYIEPEDIPLKGYAQYIEDSQAIYLTDDNNQFVLNLKVPQKITTPTLQDKHEGIFAKRPVQYSKYEAEEFQIIPKEGSGIVTQGPISFGTNMTRDEAQAVIKSMGGKPSSSVSKNTSFVIAGENPGSKFDKAKNLGVIILTEDEFLEMIKTNSLPSGIEEK